MEKHRMRKFLWILSAVLLVTCIASVVPAMAAEDQPSEGTTADTDAKTPATPFD